MIIPAAAQSHNIAEIVPHPGTGERVGSRLPESLRVALNDNARRNAFHSAGCEIRCRLIDASAAVRVRACETIAHHGGGLAQILFGDFSATYAVVEPGETTILVKAPDYDSLERAAAQARFHPRLLRVMLPTHATISGVEIEGDIAPPEPGDVPTRRALFYGSSITQGNGSLTARESWAGRCAHLLGVDLLNLGLGGGCHCEPEMATYLATRDDFDFAVLETGINMRALDPSMTDERIAHLIRSFAAAHSAKPVFCVGVFPCADDIANGFRGRIGQMRDVVKNVVAEIASPNLHYLDGGKALNPAIDLTTDLVHPSPSGMIAIGEWAAREIDFILSND